MISIDASGFPKSVYQALKKISHADERYHALVRQVLSNSAALTWESVSKWHSESYSPVVKELESALAYLTSIVDEVVEGNLPALPFGMNLADLFAWHKHLFVVYNELKLSTEYQP